MKHKPFDNRQYGTLQKLGIPKISQEIVDQAEMVFKRHKLTGQETMLELGIIEGHHQMIEWLRNKVQAESCISGNPDDLKE